MVFSSITFLFFFLPLVLVLYFLSPGIRLKNTLLLLLSWVFYAWGEGELVILMILSSAFNYLIGLWINRSKTSSFPLFIGVAGNLLTLIYFKYIGLLVGSIDAIIGTEWNNGIDIHLPIGISFFTFQSISYIVDLQRGNVKVQKNPFDLMLYISLFPQLIAGPIVRYTQIERDLADRKHSIDGFVSGIKRFCIGLAKKVLIANVMGEISDEILDMPNDEMYYALSWFAISAYALQIYFDFSGYSDMAIGLGRMFGFHFPENFNYPYIASSIKEFWRRWHITLSTWFRDYLYIPLGGNRKGIGRVYFNLIVVFFITGMWHGGTWNFVLWGLMHGMFLIIERLGFDKVLSKSRVVGHIYTILVVLLAWVLFRIPDWTEAVSFYKSLVRFAPFSEGLLLTELLDREYIIMFVLGILFCMPVRYPLLKVKHTFSATVQAWLEYPAMIYHLLLLLLSVMSIASSTYNPFIYFRF